MGFLIDSRGLAHILDGADDARKVELHEAQGLLERADGVVLSRSREVPGELVNLVRLMACRKRARGEIKRGGGVQLRASVGDGRAWWYPRTVGRLGRAQVRRGGWVRDGGRAAP